MEFHCARTSALGTHNRLIYSALRRGTTELPADIYLQGKPLLFFSVGGILVPYAEIEILIIGH
jgi:hypothetical protein